jgi:hypothetical protein
VHDDVRQVVVVEPSPAELRLGQVEAEWLDQVEHGSGGRDQTDRVAGVPGDAGLEQDDVQHLVIVPRLTARRIGA